MNYSVVVVPVTTADRDVDVFDPSYQPLNETDEKNWKACMTHYFLIYLHQQSISNVEILNLH